MDAAYDSGVIRSLLLELGFEGIISRTGVPAPIQVGSRWVIERTNFVGCRDVAHIDNTFGIDNGEQGKPVSVCTGIRASCRSCGQHSARPADAHERVRGT